MVKKRKFLQIDYKQKYPFVTLLLDLMPFIVIAGIIILAILGYLNQEKFNPKTNVCLKYFNDADKNEFGCIDWRSKTEQEKLDELYQICPDLIMSRGITKNQDLDNAMLNAIFSLDSNYRLFLSKENPQIVALWGCN